MVRALPNATQTSAVVVLLLLISAPASARSLAAPATSLERTVAQARGLVMGRVPVNLGQRTTLQAKSMRELALRTAPIAKDAFQRYGGDVGRYFAASNRRNQRAGKTLEAVIAWRVNAQRAKLGISDRMLVTAAEGYPGHAADLIDIAQDGSILGKYQVKWGETSGPGWKSTIKALRNPKYQDMTILTTRESWQTIARKLSAAEARAARRGIALAPKWQVVREAIDSERLPRIVGGKHLPRAAAVQRFAESMVRRFFGEKAAQSVPRTAAKLGQLAPVLAGTGKVLGRVLVVADIAGTGYAEYHDIQRFRAGEIGPYYLAFKSYLRVYQLDLALLAVLSPEPLTKLTAGILAGALVVVDLASDQIYDLVYKRRQDAARVVLESIDREERYHAARFSLVQEIQLIH